MGPPLPAPDSVRSVGNRRLWGLAALVGCVAAGLLLGSWPSAASACGPYTSSCNNPTLNVAGQVFVVAVIVAIVGSAIWWRFGKGGPVTRLLLWIENRRVRRAARRDEHAPPSDR